MVEGVLSILFNVSARGGEGVMVVKGIPASASRAALGSGRACRGGEGPLFPTTVNAPGAALGPGECHGRGRGPEQDGGGGGGGGGERWEGTIESSVSNMKETECVGRQGEGEEEREEATEESPTVVVVGGGGGGSGAVRGLPALAEELTSEHQPPYML